MCNKYKVLGVLLTAFLYGCTGNSGSSKVDVNSDIKRFSGVVNNSSVIGADVAAISIGKHGQFALNQNNSVAALTNTSDESGRFGFSISINNIGPYVLTVTAPEFDSATEAERATKMGCQVVAGCSVDGQIVSFGGYYAIGENRQWSAAVQSVENSQFIVVNPITEMARALGYTAYVNDGIDPDLNNTSKPSANYYSNYNIAKSNSQTASLLGLGDILSKEPVDLARLHELDVNGSASIEESIRYGALIAAWQELELEYDDDIQEGDDNFQQKVIKEYLLNKGQLYQADALDNQIVSLKIWYEAAYKNLEQVRDYHSALNRSVPSEINLVIQRFKTEIDGLVSGKLTKAKPIIPEYYENDYTDAVMKTKAMVNYISHLKENFATDEYRESLKNTSDIVMEQNRLLAPKLDVLLEQLLTVYEYYLSCAHGACDQANKLAGSEYEYDSANKILTVNSTATAKLIVSQGRVFDDDRNPEGSEETNVHDLYLQGDFEFDGLRLELSDIEVQESSSIKNSLRMSFAKKLSQLPQNPAKVEPGMGAAVDEDLVPDYIELSLTKFKLYAPANDDSINELQVFGSLTALMIANVDSGDYLKPESERLGKRYNMSSVKGRLRVAGQKKGENSEEVLRDNALFFIEASASGAFISTEGRVAHFPDTKYPTFQSFFKPRDGFEVGTISTSDLVVSRKGKMRLPKIDADGMGSEEEEVEVNYIELDYEIGGLERYVTYPKLSGESKYWGIICTANESDEDDLDEAGDGYTKPVVDEDGNPVFDDDGNPVLRSLLSCSRGDQYEGTSDPDNFINEVYALNKNSVNLKGYNGRGYYRIQYPVTDEKLNKFPEADTRYAGVLEVPVVVGVDSMRLQFKPDLVKESGTEYMPESILDISLVWRTQDVIDVNAFLAFDTERVINNPNGSGLPYLAVGSDSESYSIAYRTDAEGNESGEYAMAWRGVKFVDGAPGTTVMERTDIEDEKEGVFAGIGSNISYGGKADFSDKKCGFFGRTNDELVDAGECVAIAYFTFRGLVTGSLREEREGVYVIRYIDGSFQILGG